MKIDIIVDIQRYARGHEEDFVPVIRQQVEPVRFETDAHVIAVAFFSGFAPEGSWVA